MVLPKIALHPWQYDVLEEFFPESHAIHDWLSASFDVQIQDGPDIQTIQSKINEQLRDAYLQRLNMNYFAAQGRGKTWLGSQIAEQQEREWVQRGYRVEEMLAVPGIRGLGYSADKAYFDEACSWPTDDNRSVHGTENEESDPALGEWLQRRSICYRTSSCSLA